MVPFLCILLLTMLRVHCSIDACSLLSNANHLHGVSISSGKLYFVVKKFLYSLPLEAFNTNTSTFNLSSAFGTLTRHGFWYHESKIMPMLKSQNISFQTNQLTLHRLLLYEDEAKRKRMYLNFQRSNQKSESLDIGVNNKTRPPRIAHIETDRALIVDTSLSHFYLFRIEPPVVPRLVTTGADLLATLYHVYYPGNISIGPFYLQLSRGSLQLNFTYDKLPANYVPLISPRLGILPVSGFIHPSSFDVHLWHLDKQQVYLFQAPPFADSMHRVPVRIIPFAKYFNCSSPNLTATRAIMTSGSIVICVLIILVVLKLTYEHRRYHNKRILKIRKVNPKEKKTKQNGVERSRMMPMKSSTSRQLRSCSSLTKSTSWRMLSASLSRT